jgi:enoyl-CoA hydratase/carnithine racemase
MCLLLVAGGICRGIAVSYWAWRATVTERNHNAEEGERWGFFSRLVGSSELLDEEHILARMIGTGPTYANTMTKRMLAMEWAMSVEEAIEAEVVAQALCMTTEDFARAFAAKEKPVFKGD